MKEHCIQFKMEKVEEILKSPLEINSMELNEKIYHIIEETKKKQLEILKKKEIDYTRLSDTYCNI